MDYIDIDDKLLVIRLFSQSNNYISLQTQAVEKEDNECRAPQQIKVIFTTDRFREHDNVTFYYMVRDFVFLFIVN